MRSVGAASAVLLAVAQECAGHAYMSQPASRNAEAYNASPRAEFEPQSAGGGGGYAPCGKVAGKDYTDKVWNRAHAATHQRIVKGGVLQTEVTVTAHHWGHFEFSICDLDSLNLDGKTTEQRDALMWACFNKESNLLQRHADYEVYDPSPIDAANPTRWHLPPRSMQSWPPQGWTGAPTMGAHGGAKVYRMWLKVPETVDCSGDNCVLFYFYYSSNSCEGAGYRQYMSGTAPAAGVKNIIASSSDTLWTCAQCGLCNDNTGAEDGAVHDGKRSFDDTVSLGSPERFYGCSDVSTVTGISHAADLPPACSGAWCADQTCSCTQVTTAAPTTAFPTTTQPTNVGQTAAPTKAPTTAAPQTNAPSPAPTTGAPAEAGTCNGCADRAHDAALMSCGACLGTFCNGNSLIKCGNGLIFDGTVCNWPASQGCEGDQGFAAAREAEAGAKGNSTLVAVLAAAVAILSGSLVALVVVHLRGRKTADAAEVPYVAAKDGNCDV